MRLPLAYPLESRDGTLAKDAKLKNSLSEIIEGVSTAIKRPGVIGNVEPVPGGLAQGLIVLDGLIYALVDDVLRGPFDPADGEWMGWGIGSGYGGIGSEWNPLFEYEEGAEITYGGNTYTAIQGSQGQTPVVDSAFWQIVIVAQTWEQISTAFPATYSGHARSIVFAGKVWVGTEDATPIFYNSSDAISWGSVAKLGTAPTASGAFMVVGSEIWTWNPSYIFKSSDGITWIRTSSNHSFSSGNYHVVLVDGVFYNLQGVTIYKSTDGEVWTSTATDLAAGTLWVLKEFKGDLYALPGSNTNKYTHTSSDGITWTTVGSVFSQTLLGAAFETDSNLFYIATSNSVRTSSDMITWDYPDYTDLYTSREYAALQFFGGDLYILGGVIITYIKTDVWKRV